MPSTGIRSTLIANLFVHFLLFVELSAQQAAAAAPSPSSLHPSDFAALLDIRRNVRDLPRSNFFSSWEFDSDGNTTAPCTSFAGVACVSDGAFFRIVVLTLGTGLADSPGLTGVFPSSITALTALTDLVLYPGRVSGTIPFDIGARLRSLRLLSISNNLLTGSVPASLGGLPDLHTLDLGGNRLEGPIPRSLIQPSSPSLKILILAGNGRLSGEIPAEFSASQIIHLDLSKNSITGSMPPLPATLMFLSVGSNEMSGTLEEAFTGRSLPDLEYLDLSMNQFYGKIPPSVFVLPVISSLLIDRNNLSGALDVPELTTEPKWSVIDLSHNAITGGVPAALAAAKSLYVNNNKMVGAVPPEVAASVFNGKMTTFYAQHNFLTGFPAPPLQLPDSVALCLSYNCMELSSSSSAASGCPTSAGDLQSRPTYQCRAESAAAASTNDDGGEG